MGCFSLKPRRQIYEDSDTLAAQTHFTVTEVKALFELFRKLSSTIKDDGLISKEEFQIGVFRNSKKQSFFTDRMFMMFDSNDDGFIDFGEFVRALSIFHPQSPQEHKVSFLFKLYDTSHSGFIEREGVKEMVDAILHESELTLSDDIIESIINKTFEEADCDGDGKIDSEDWKDFVSRNPSVLKNMTIPYLKGMTAAFPSFLMKSDIEDEDE